MVKGVIGFCRALFPPLPALVVEQYWDNHLFRPIHVLFFIVLCTGIGLGQSAKSVRVGERSPSQKGLDALVGQLSGLPAEYKADLGFAIIDAEPSSLSQGQKRALLNRIFRSAASALYPSMEVDAAHHEGESLSHLTENVLFDLKSDALDIQTRAVERALRLSPQFATHLFEELKVDEVRASCKNAAVEDVSAFYNVATKIIQDKRIRTVFKQDKALYLLTLASNMRIPAQIAPLASIIPDASLSPEQLRQVEIAFVASLTAITASDRELTAAEETGHLTHAIELFSAKLAKSGISSEPLLAEYRGFLLRSLTRERCADYSLDRVKMARRFNGLIPNTKPESPEMSPLSDTDLTPKSTGESASDEMVPWNKQLIPQIRRILLAHSARVAEEYRLGQPGTIEPEPSDVEDIVKDATSLEPSDAACPVCDFYSKCISLTRLVNMLPPGHQLERAINAEIDFLSFSAMQRDNPTAWVYYLKMLINISRKPTDAAIVALTAEAKKRNLAYGLPNPEAVAIRDGLRRSSDPIIATYMSAENLLHLRYLPLHETQAK